MKKNLSVLICLSVFLFYFDAIQMNSGSAFASQGIWSELTADQQKQIQKGEQIFYTVDTQESSWPKVYLYQTVSATPEEVAAVFWDFEFRPQYISSIVKAEISNLISKTEVEVDYEVYLPIISNEKSTIWNKLSNYDNGQSYRVDWKMKRADSAKSIVGNIRMEPMAGGTLVAYYNYLIPDAMFAGAVKDKAMRELREQLTVIFKQVEKERTQMPDLLERQLKKVRDAFSK